MLDTCKPSLATVFEPTWESLRRHQSPQWLADAKFGIYSHWGLSTIRHQPGCGDLTHEQQIERFTAPRFDPEAWADLYRTAGARFAGPIIWHGSPFLHWDSAISTHNSARLGPGRDIAGEVLRAVNAAGMRGLVSFHTIDNGTWPDLAEEVVDRYAPDIVWVDASFGGTKASQHFEIIQDSHFLGGETDAADGPNLGHHPADHIEQLDDRSQRRVIAHHFNAGAASGREVDFVYKSHDIPPGIGMRDLENGLMPNSAYDTWMTDLDLHAPTGWEEGWFYTEDMPLRSAADIVRRLMDVISKNGVLLLNAPPAAGGAFTDDVASILRAIGAWLERFGEAVYDTSPWYLHGEGPTRIEPRPGSLACHHNDHFNKTQFVPEDLRFTTREDTLYVASLGKPHGTLRVKALGTRYRFDAGRILDVRLLGDTDRLDWSHTPVGLDIRLPDNLPLDELANVFAVSLAA
ncbi:MAG: alpha-L-fucosidase [Planctomycetota bacterium]